MTTIRRGIYVNETRDESDLDDDEIDEIHQDVKDIERSKALRERAAERVDDDDLPEATTLLLADDAGKGYTVCTSCYRKHRHGAWAGSLPKSKPYRFDQEMNKRLEAGVPCHFCKRDRIKELKEELADEVDVEVEIHTPDGVER